MCRFRYAIYICSIEVEVAGRSPRSGSIIENCYFGIGYASTFKCFQKIFDTSWITMVSFIFRIRVGFRQASSCVSGYIVHTAILYFLYQVIPPFSLVIGSVSGGIGVKQGFIVINLGCCAVGLLNFATTQFTLITEKSTHFKGMVWNIVNLVWSREYISILYRLCNNR